MFQNTRRKDYAVVSDTHVSEYP